MEPHPFQVPKYDAHDFYIGESSNGCNERLLNGCVGRKPLFDEKGQTAHTDVMSAHTDVLGIRNGQSFWCIGSKTSSLLKGFPEDQQSVLLSVSLSVIVRDV
jgi:hypothetical protein